MDTWDDNLMIICGFMLVTAHL